jgi:hypothetical protein
MVPMYVALTMMAVKGLASASGTNTQINNEIYAMERKRDALRKQGIKIRSQFHAKASQAQMFGDYEESRINRIQQFKISQKKASIGGSGAATGSGTTYDIVLSQQAEDRANLDLHSFKVMTESNNLKYEGQRQYNSLYAQAEGIDLQIHRTHRQRNERVLTSMLTQGASGFTSGMQMANAYNTAYPGKSDPGTS